MHYPSTGLFSKIWCTAMHIWTQSEVFYFRQNIEKQIYGIVIHPLTSYSHVSILFNHTCCHETIKNHQQVPAPLLTRRVSLVEQELFPLSLCCLSFFDVVIGYYVFVYLCSGISAVFLHIEFEWRFVAVICFMILYLILFGLLYLYRGIYMLGL
jgi:hypothetical protein